MEALGETTISGTNVLASAENYMQALDMIWLSLPAKAICSPYPSEGKRDKNYCQR